MPIAYLKLKFLYYLFQNKESKLKSTSNSYDSKLSSYDRQLLEDMRVSSPKPNRLTTIDEGKFYL